jgi:hypothetical protein
MILKEISYCEYRNTNQHWKLNDCGFKHFNFIVGKNATGKSRTISLIHNLSKIISGERTEIYNDGATKFVLEETIEEKTNTWTYLLDIQDQKVTSETLEYNGNIILKRDSKGDGEVYYESVGKSLEIRLPTDQLAISKYQDEIQQPATNKFTNWARDLTRLNFGSDLGQNIFLTEEHYAKALSSNKPNNNSIIESYVVGYNMFGEDFDIAIKSDMKKLGYNIKDVNSGRAQLNPNSIESRIFALHTVEEELGFNNVQINLSQGMYRALATIILINFRFFRKEPTTILIDDIGEGLDFERSSALVKILLEKSTQSELQIIMTSNDKFIMNTIPLEHWIILKRKAQTVTAYNHENSKEKFDNFKFIGLSNFDFFSMELFEKDFL